MIMNSDYLSRKGMGILLYQVVNLVIKYYQLLFKKQVVELEIITENKENKKKEVVRDSGSLWQENINYMEMCKIEIGVQKFLENLF